MKMYISKDPDKIDKAFKEHGKSAQYCYDDGQAFFYGVPREECVNLDEEPTPEPTPEPKTKSKK